MTGYVSSLWKLNPENPELKSLTEIVGEWTNSSSSEGMSSLFRDRESAKCLINFTKSSRFLWNDNVASPSDAGIPSGERLWGGGHKNTDSHPHEWWHRRVRFAISYCENCMLSFIVSKQFS